MASGNGKNGMDGRNVTLMGATSMMNDTGSEMIAPILPLLMASLGANGFIIGVLGGLRDSISSLMSIYFGRMSDKIGKRKPFVVSGYLLSGIFKLFLFLSTTWPVALVSASLERMSKAVRNAPRDALISESVTKGNLGKGFGIHRAMDTLGAVIGSVLALCFVYYLKLDFGTIILIASVLAFFSIVPLFFVREGPPTGKLNGNGRRLENERLNRLIMIITVFSLGNISYMFLMLQAQQLFPKDLQIVGPMALYILFNIAYAALAIPFGRFADRFGKKRTLDIGYLLLFLTMFGFIFANSLPLYALLFMLFGAAYAIIETEQSAVVSSMSEDEERGTALGKYYTYMGVSKLIGSSVAGFVWTINPVYTFVYSSALTAAGAFMLFGYTHPTKKV
jgi:MFS family permease